MPSAVAGPEIERLIQLLAKLPGLGPRSARRAALVALQQHLWQAVPVVPVGQYVQPYAARDTLSGILKSHIIVFWNIAKS